MVFSNNVMPVQWLVDGRQKFDALTEDASQLLNAGDAGVYTRKREELIRDLETSKVGINVIVGSLGSRVLWVSHTCVLPNSTAN